MLAVDQQEVGQDLCIEIRACVPNVPAAAAELQRLGVCLLERSRLFCFEALPRPLEPERLSVLFDPLVEGVSILQRLGDRSGEVGRREGSHSGGHPQGVPLQAPGPTAPMRALVAGGESIPLSVDVFCRPGVTDAEGDMASLALAHAGLPDARCRAGYRYRFAGDLSRGMRPAVERALGNPLIHTFGWSDTLQPLFTGGVPDATPRGDAVEIIELRGAGDEELLAISRSHNLALDREEMRAVAAHYAGLGRAPTDVELQSLALAWSEHCCHKTFKATIDFEHDGRRERIPGLLHSCIVEPTLRL
ncbi:MAG: hypothetical protein JOZ41_01950, partial [Chloroflexi bacterium]|nr:hypothetical protein [Chloroflexota bacterium]